MKPKVLVVDDEPLIRMDLVELVQLGGFDTLEASNAAEALQLLERDNQIRVVFTDIRMPGEMDGIALAHAVRDRWPPTVIVICSGNAPPPPEKLPRNVTFLSKPCNGPKLEALLSSILSEIQ